MDRVDRYRRYRGGRTVSFLTGFALLVGLIVPGSALAHEAEAAQTTESIQLRMRFAPGETRTYASEVTTTVNAPGGEPVEALLSMQYTALVLAALPEGGGLVVFRFDRAAVTARGESAPIPGLVGGEIQARITALGGFEDVQFRPEAAANRTSTSL